VRRGPETSHSIEMRKDSPIWAITSYYNPLRGARRYANYRAFWRNLAIPLVTVEWSANADFQLAKDDADVLVQVSGGDLMWQDAHCRVARPA
jgi:hypothetical protein